MKIKTGTWVILCEMFVLLVRVRSGDSGICNRMIDGTKGRRSNAEEKYHFYMTVYNQTERVYAYMPNTKYTVSVMAEDTGKLVRRFTRFLISAEAERANETTENGVFDLIDESLSTFSESCPNAVVETSKVEKKSISVAWSSPSEGSGCILIRATIVETADTWYMDDSNLVMRMCQDSKAEADDQGPVQPTCCACEEAKYEVAFEGLWSRNTHPKDFPSKSWEIRFSDVIGASHAYEYRFWRYNGMASEGLRQVAERGSTRQLESELKDQSNHIRTIIKARGIGYPNVTGKTFAVFRVDRIHHLMSLVSMIVPSPDWIVGVSGLELCLTNCTWIEHKELNLYPYDAGTDNGITYLAPDEPTNPPESIRRITSSYPNDTRSPFYDPAGLDMKPMARLYLNRQRLYEKTCDGLPSESTLSEACKVTSWGSWGPCNCDSGEQLRQRFRVNVTAANAVKCPGKLTERRPCFVEKATCNSSILNTEMCALEEWSSWSSCSASCGTGSKTKTRNFKHKRKRKLCKAEPNGPVLQQTINCDTEVPCPEEQENERKVSPVLFRGAKENGENGENGEMSETNDGEEAMEDYEGDRPMADATTKWLQSCLDEDYSKWSLWTPCSSSCGPGVKLRTRLYTKNWDSLEKKGDVGVDECKLEQTSCLAKIPTCNFTKEEAEKICSQPMERGTCDGNILRNYFDKESNRCHFFSYSGCDGNQNNFQTEQDCTKVCRNYQKKNAEFRGMESRSQIVESTETAEEPVDCRLSEWSDWSPCNRCRGYTFSTRRIQVPPNGAGKDCPKKVLRKKKCHKTPLCSSINDGVGRRSYRDRNSEPDFNEISVNCKVSGWSGWSRCTATCGESYKHRSRTVKTQPSGPNGKLCPPLVEFHECSTDKCPN